jgi:uncharacterized protein DUF4175
MAVAYAEIARALAGARRRQGWIAAAAGLGHGLAAAFAFLLLGTLALSFGAGAWARPAALSLALLALAAAVAWTAWTIRRTALGEAAAARALAAHDEGLRSDLLSAVELETERGEVERTGRFSLELLDAHVTRTAERARAVNLRRAIPSRLARRAGLAAAGVALAHLLALAVGGADLGRAYGRVLGGERAPVGPPRAEPITGDVEITYHYPAYMGRPERKLSGTGGEIAAPPGTEVRLRTRSDRPVVEAQILIEGSAAAAAPASAAAEPSSAAGRASAKPPPTQSPPARQAGAGAAAREGPQVLALTVENGRDLSGGFVVKDAGSYRFRFTKGSKVLALGPPVPVVVEPDAYPEVRITAPASEVEVDARARVRVDWTASDDVGLTDLALVTKAPAGDEKRRVVQTFAPGRRQDGSLELDLAPWRLAEGEKLLYWLEVRDNDAVSGPKRSASPTHTVKIYSEAEHHQAALAKAQALWEELVRLLGDRLERLPRGGDPTLERVVAGESFDTRGRALAQRLRDGAAELRRDRSAPEAIAAALTNVAGGLRAAVDRATSARSTLGRLLRTARPGEPRPGRWMDDLDGEMDAEVEKDVLYLEKLFDKLKADDLVRLAKDLAGRRRDLASLLEKYRQAPGAEARRELLAEVSRLKARMRDLLARMADLAKGIDDEHMNAEALAELSRSNDLMGGLDRVAEMLRKGDVEKALKELDAMGSALQQMLASLQRTADHPERQNEALAREMRELERQLRTLQAEQERLAAETERSRAEYRRRVAERMQSAEERARRMEALASEARERVREAGKGVGMRSEEPFGMSRDRLQDLQRALAMRDFDAALETVRRALPPMQRLATELEEDALTAERYSGQRGRDSAQVRDAARKARAALPPARQVRQELEELFPDPRTVLAPGEQAGLERQSRRQAELEREAGAMQQLVQELMRAAPVFPQRAPQLVGESRGHMLQAAEDLGRRNPQRGHSQQKQALDALARFRKGLEEMAKQGGGGAGGGFPFPFAVVEMGGGGDGSMGEPSREKVEIPGADAHRSPEEFRRDLLEAMRQGAPEAYQAEVKRYYEELVR